MQDVLREWKVSQLRGHLVWLPMLPADNLETAFTQEALFQDERVSQYWDGERALGRLVSLAMNLSTPIAWDIYLLYLPETMWTGQNMPPPVFWMHQLDERLDLLLDPGRLMAEVQKALYTYTTLKREFLND